MRAQRLLQEAVRQTIYVRQPEVSREIEEKIRQKLATGKLVKAGGGPQRKNKDKKI